MTTADEQTIDNPEIDTPEVPKTPEIEAPEESDVTVTDAPEGPDTQGSNGFEAPETPEASGEPAGDPDTFDRAYVEDLRKESAGYRTQLREVQEQLHRALVEKSGALADPADLPFDAAHLADPETLQAAIETLVADKPHLKARKFAPGAAGQGPKASATAGVDLLGMLRANA